ncbi:MAG: toll/interleukin-1 receptor domain-containing protein [Candidatus Sulfotelmatobacter sp.]
MLIQLEATPTKPKPRKLFYSYSHKDESLRDELDAHLTLLKREGFISDWHDRKIRAGDDWGRAISDNLISADVILFLVSPHFLASTYCRDVEVARAMERHSKGEATVVPIILKPCVWMTKEFAKLEPLPKTGRPISEWPDSGFAQVAEELRVLLLEFNYPRRPDSSQGGMHGHWILKVRDQGKLADRTATEKIVERLKDFTKDFSITLQATAKSQVADGEQFISETILIFSGTSEAFVAIQEEKNKGTLSMILSVEVISFYIGYGATIQGTSEPITNSAATVIETGDLLLRPGRKVFSSVLKGVKAKDNNPKSLDFIIDKGNQTQADFVAKGDFEKQLDYFKAALTVKEENMWVNLSAYEADRMLPKPLAGTQFGRDLLSQDVVLKQLTASFMHPDSPIGRAYWNEVFARARQHYGTSNLRMNSFQKVWVVPKKALVYEMPFEEPPPDILERFDIERGERFAYIVETDLDTLCECDLVALKHHVDSQQGKGDGTSTDFTVQTFKEMVLPHIQKEVNESEHFVALRQIYHALILATWFKKKLRSVPAYKELFESVDSDNPASLPMTIRSVKSLDSQKVDREPTVCSVLQPDTKHNLDHATPNAPAFDIADNVEFYQKYIRLFRNGVFRCARAEEGDKPGEIINRMYFSGAIRFDSLPMEVKNTFSK